MSCVSLTAASQDSFWVSGVCRLHCFWDILAPKEFCGLLYMFSEEVSAVQGHRSTQTLCKCRHFSFSFALLCTNTNKYLVKDSQDGYFQDYCIIEVCVKVVNMSLFSEIVFT